MLGFVVIHEVFNTAFRPFVALRDLSGIIFRWACIVLLVIAIVMAITSGSLYHLPQEILAVERGVFLMQGGLLLFLLMYSSRLGMTWKQHGFVISLGLGVNASSHLVLKILGPKMVPGWPR